MFSRLRPASAFAVRPNRYGNRTAPAAGSDQQEYRGYDDYDLDHTVSPRSCNCIAGATTAFNSQDAATERYTRSYSRADRVQEKSACIPFSRKRFHVAVSLKFSMASQVER